MVRLPLSLGWTRRLEQEICEQLVCTDAPKGKQSCLTPWHRNIQNIESQKIKELRFSSFCQIFCIPNNEESSNNSVPLHLEMVMALKQISYAYLLVLTLS